MPIRDFSSSSSKSFIITKFSRGIFKRTARYGEYTPFEGQSTTDPAGYEFTDDEKERLLQASVFLEDAIKYRSIYHKTDTKALWYYQQYYSKFVQCTLHLAIVVIHLLAFIESPSSLTLSSDPNNHPERPNLPCGITESLEMICITIFFLDFGFKLYIIGMKYFLKKRWLVAYLIVLVLYSVNLLTTAILFCSENVRFRRLLRPFFMLQNSSLMKKTVRCLKNTLPQIASVLLLLALHLFFYTMLGMLILPDNEKVLGVIIPGSNYVNITLAPSDMYFNSLSGAMFNLFILLTTANSPDLMIPWYKNNRFYAIYFMSFMIIGIYCLMNMLTAITYNQFRGYFLRSMQSSVVRRKVGIQVAFEVLRGLKPLHQESSFHVKCQSVSVPILRSVLLRLSMPNDKKDWMIQTLDSDYNVTRLEVLSFHDFFRLLDKTEPLAERPEMKRWNSKCLKILQKVIAHKYISCASFIILSVNVICITVELSMDYTALMSSSHSLLAVLNLIFISYYILEQLLKVIILGWRHYFWDASNIFDFCITVVLCILELVFIIFYGSPFSERKEKFVLSTFRTLWMIVRVINIIIICRLFRVIVFIRSMIIITSVLADIIKNLRAFIGILVVAYYCFAILGVEIFQGVISKLKANDSAKFVCGSYEQSDFWSHNFDDFASAIIVLWDVMVVNNWQVITTAYARASGSQWTYLYFIAWYLVALVFCMNLLTAFILENFIMKWDRLSEGDTDVQNGRIFRLSSLHDMFRELIKEPSFDQLQDAIQKHHYLSLRSECETSEPTTSN